MEKRTKLRLFGGLVLLFNIWLIGRYDVKGLPTLLLTFGFALCYEFLVVRLASPSDPQKEVGGEPKIKQVLLWAAVGAFLSLFLAHPPQNHLDPMDRLADRAIGMAVWAILGAVAFFIVSIFRRAPAQPVEISSPEPTTLHEPISPLPALSRQEEMEQLGVSKDGDRYRYQTYLYDRLDDAINYARKDRSRVYQCK